jgi:hypothetical protein
MRSSSGFYQNTWIWFFHTGHVSGWTYLLFCRKILGADKCLQVVAHYRFVWQKHIDLYGRCLYLWTYRFWCNVMSFAVKTPFFNHFFQLFGKLDATIFSVDFCQSIQTPARCFCVWSSVDERCSLLDEWCSQVRIGIATWYRGLYVNSPTDLACLDSTRWPAHTSHTAEHTWGDKSFFEYCYKAHNLNVSFHWNET